MITMRRKTFFAKIGKKIVKNGKKGFWAPPKKNPEYAPKLTWNSKHEGNLTDGYGYVQL